MSSQRNYITIWLVLYKVKSSNTMLKSEEEWWSTKEKPGLYWNVNASNTFTVFPQDMGNGHANTVSLLIWTNIISQFQVQILHMKLIYSSFVQDTAMQRVQLINLEIGQWVTCRVDAD